MKNLKMGLKRKGHKVIAVMNSQEALKVLDATDCRDIDLVVTDHTLPIMNGMKLLRSIRKTHGSLPVIIVTSHVREMI